MHQAAVGRTPHTVERAFQARQLLCAPNKSIHGMRGGHLPKFTTKIGTLFGCSSYDHFTG